MESHSLLMVCASAFAAVFLLLGLLAMVMRLIIVVFPEEINGTDTAIFAAVGTAAVRVYPGRKISKIEEIK